MENKIEQAIVENYNSNLKDKNQRMEKKETIKNVVDTLIKRLDIVPPEVAQLRNESRSLFEVADIIENFAKAKEKESKKKINTQELDKIKKVLLEALGIRAEFVDILMSKGSPEELKAAANTIKQEAKGKEQEANSLHATYKNRIEKQIATAQNLDQNISELEERSDISYMKFLSEHRDYLKRLEAELPLQQMLLEQVRQEELRGTF